MNRAAIETAPAYCERCVTPAGVIASYRVEGVRDPRHAAGWQLGRTLPLCSTCARDMSGAYVIEPAAIDPGAVRDPFAHVYVVERRCSRGVTVVGFFPGPDTAAHNANVSNMGARAMGDPARYTVRGIDARECDAIRKAQRATRARVARRAVRARRVRVALSVLAVFAACAVGTVAILSATWAGMTWAGAVGGAVGAVLSCAAVAVGIELVAGKLSGGRA